MHSDSTAHRLHYVSICHYCGCVFLSNRPTAKFCPNSSHRSLFFKNGSRISRLLKDQEGNYVDVNDILDRLYMAYPTCSKNRGWKGPYSEGFFTRGAGHCLPLPQGAELLVMGSYVLRRYESGRGEQTRIDYYLMPFKFLRVEERVTGVFRTPDGREFKAW